MATRKSRPTKPVSAGDRMTRLTESLPTKAAKIRKLGAAGFKRQAIADFLGISYHHVRNVLVQSRRARASYSEPATVNRAGLAESPASYQPPATVFKSDIGIARFNIDSEGRITLTPELLAALQAEPGSLITARLEGDELIVMGLDASVRFARKLAAPYIKPGEPRWSDQIIAERRAEVAREAEEERRWRKKRS